MILISGKQGSGKTSTAKEVILALEARGYSARPITLAKPLKVMETMIWDYLVDMYGLQRPEKDGLLLQLLGTEWGRKTFGDDVWVNFAKISMESQQLQVQPKELVFVLDDARFPNEFDAFPHALRVRLECPEEVRKARAVGWRDWTQHPSEVGLDSYAQQGKFDKLFWTNGSQTAEQIAAEIVLAWEMKRLGKKT